MKKLIIFLVTILPLVVLAEAYQSTLLVQTGKLRESDLIVRTVTDLESHKICQAFYVRTTGTSPVISCYDAVSGYASNVNQVGHFKEGQLVVRKIKDSVNDMACLVAYVSTEGTSPSIDCYKSRQAGKDDMVRNGHLSEGDLDVYRIIDADSTKTCLVGYVSVLGTSPALTCYNSVPDGDLIVRKISDLANSMECLITYVSTEGTSPYIYCSQMPAGLRPAPVFRSSTAADPTR